LENNLCNLDRHIWKTQTDMKSLLKYDPRPFEYFRRLDSTKTKFLNCSRRPQTRENESRSILNVERTDRHEAHLGMTDYVASIEAKNALRFRATESPNHRTKEFYRFFHPPRCPGAPPLERGAGPNSGPDWRESVGWKILLPLPAAMSSGEGFRAEARPGR
jgi:hypothetical protein